MEHTAVCQTIVFSRYAATKLQRSTRISETGYFFSIGILNEKNEVNTLHCTILSEFFYPAYSVQQRKKKVYSLFVFSTGFLLPLIPFHSLPIFSYFFQFKAIQCLHLLSFLVDIILYALLSPDFPPFKFFFLQIQNESKKLAPNNKLKTP